MAKDGAGDEEIEQLERRKKEAELKKATAEAEKSIAEANEAKLKALTPEGATKPLEGNITKDEKSGYISDLVAYHSIIKVADQIAKEITEPQLENAKILIVESLDFCGDDVLLLQVCKQFELFQTRMEEINGKLQEELTKLRKIEELKIKESKAGEKFIGPALPALAVAPSILSIVADTIGYFKADYDIKGRDINISEIALRVKLASRIKKTIPVYFMNFHRIEDSSIIKSLDTCIKKRLDLLITMSNAEGLIKAEGNDLAEKRNDLEEGNDPKKLEQIIELYKGSEVLIKEFDEFNKALTTVAEGKSSSLLSIVAVRQYLIDQKITHLLYATIPSGGGETITKKRVLSLSSGDTRFLGGGVVSYVLSDTKGKIIAANTLIEMTAIRYDLDQKGPLKFSD